MPGPFVHDVDPVLAEVAGVYLWWYGLSYALGFVQIKRWLDRHRTGLALSRSQVYDLSLFFCLGVLLGGRAVEVAFDEWPFYREHPHLIPAIWLGGMATHGLLVGAAASTAAFAIRFRRPFLELADALVIPGALLMGLGRIGNFIDGQIVGSPTDGWWGVQFPDADGFRHPVVLYDGLKNLLLIPLLLWIRRRDPTPGATAAHFVFWYASLRIGIDLFRDYPTHRLAFGTGQTLNLLMTALGVALLLRSRLRRLGRLAPRRPLPPPSSDHSGSRAGLGWRRLVFAALLALCLTIPSNWTQDVPARYGDRHAGLRHSRLYPPLDTAPRGTAPHAGPRRPRSD